MENLKQARANLFNPRGIAKRIAVVMAVAILAAVVLKNYSWAPLAIGLVLSGYLGWRWYKSNRLMAEHIDAMIDLDTILKDEVYDHHIDRNTAHPGCDFLTVFASMPVHGFDAIWQQIDAAREAYWHHKASPVAAIEAMRNALESLTKVKMQLRKEMRAARGR